MSSDLAAGLFLIVNALRAALLICELKGSLGSVSMGCASDGGPTQNAKRMERASPEQFDDAPLVHDGAPVALRTEIMGFTCTRP